MESAANGSVEPLTFSPGPPVGAGFSAEGLLDGLPWAVLVLDEQRIIRRVNQQAARWCGASPERLLGRSLTEAALPPAVSAALMQLLEPGEAEPCEVYLPQSGQWVALSATRQPGGWVLYGQDITPQKRREQQYQALAENTPDVLTRWGPDLRLRYANAAFADKSGATLAELRGRTNREMGQPEDISGPYMAALQRVFDTGQPQEHFNSFPMPHGEVHYHSRLVPELRNGRVETVLGIARDITAIKQNEAAALQLRDELARRTADHYHALFHRMDQGFCVLELAFDDTGQQVVDFLYQQLNPVFFQQSGIPEDVLGKRSRAVMPDLEPFWFETYGRVARTGESERLEHYVPQVGRWFDVHVFPVGAPEARQVGVLFHDVTARKQAEEQLRAAAETDAFRLRLADALAPLADAVAIQDAVTRLTRQYFAADRCYYVELEENLGHIRCDAAAEGLPPIAGTHPLADFTLLLAGLEAGQPFQVRNVRQDAAVDDGMRQLCVQLHIASYLNVPVHKNGRPVGVLTLAQSQPRAWTAAEAALAGEVAERAWAAVERARAEAALRESEVRRDLALETAALGTYVWHAREDRTEADARLLALFGRAEETHATFAYMLDQGLHPDDRAAYVDVISRAMDPAGDGRLQLDFRVVHPDQSVHWMASTGQALFAGQPRQAVRIIGTVADITARKQAEEHQAFELKMADALRPLSDAGEIQSTALRLLGEHLRLDRCGYGEIHADDEHATVHRDHHVPGFTSFAGTYRLEDFGQEILAAMRRGDTLAVADITADPDNANPVIAASYDENSIRAFVATPLVKDGRLVALLFAHHRTPRPWMPADVALIEETAERTWAAVERARAEEALRLAEERYRRQLEQQVAERTLELQESRSLLQTVFNASPTAIVVMRLLRDAAGQPEDFEILIFNEFNKQVTGRADLMGQRFTAMFPQTVPTGILARLLAVATTGEPADFEQWYEGEGMQHWFRHIVVRQDGLLVLTSEVITARKLLEQAQTRSLALLQQSEAVAGMGSWEYDLRTHEFTWSDGLYRLFDQPVGSAIRLQFLLDAVLDDDRPAAAQLVRTLTATPRSFDTTLRLRIGAAVMTVRFKAVPLPDAPGPSERVLGVCLDVSDVQRLEAENLALKLDRHKELLLAILQAQETERQRLGEVLHNGLGQILYATKLRLDQLDSPALQALPAWAGLHEETARLLAEAMRQNRTLAHELVPTSLLNFGLAAAVRDVCRDLSTPQLRIACHVWGEEPEQEKTLPQPVQVTLFRLAQELALNIVRHAGATEATLELETIASGVSLRAEDNGHGFDPKTVAEGLGLRTVRDAVALLGGTVAVDSSPEFGTHIRLRIPLPLFS